MSGLSTSSGSTGPDSAMVDSRDGGVISITLDISTGGGGGSLTSGGVASSESLASGEVGLFFNSGNGEVWMIG